MDVVLVGYQPRLFRKKHTNFWPWNYLTGTFRKLGYQTWHLNANKIDHSKPHIYICWNEPDTIHLFNKYNIHKDSVLVQKLTSFDGSPESVGKEWTDNPMRFFQEWHWPQYKKLDQLSNSGYRFYAFGAKTDVDSFPMKKKIVDKYKDRIFWIPWGTMTVSYDEIMNAKPVMDGFKYDLGFVGSRWGTMYRGNILEWDNWLQPLVDKAKTSVIAGRGTKLGPVSVAEHIDILKSSRLCPIIHAASWKVEKGIMDRFWTVFSLGRFGVIDNAGILDFYNEDEIVLATEKEDYIEKSLYYMNNVEKQKPYIEKALKRIQQEYNQYIVWKNILDKISSDH
jgi:hypothetical protein